jgi:hydrogenase maturation factor HypE
MAGYCTGVAVSWRGTALGEVSEFRINAGGSLPIGRDSTFAVDAGTVEVSSLATAAMKLSEYGTKGLLSFSGGGLTVTTKAICQTLDISAKVNDVYRLKSTFRIVRE